MEKMVSFVRKWEKWIKHKRYQPRGSECLGTPQEERGNVYITCF